MGTKYMLALFACAALLLAGCVSSSEYVKVQQELNESKAANQRLLADVQKYNTSDYLWNAYKEYALLHRAYQIEVDNEWDFYDQINYTASYDACTTGTTQYKKIRELDNEDNDDTVAFFEKVASKVNSNTCTQRLGEFKEIVDNLKKLYADVAAKDSKWCYGYYNDAENTAWTETYWTPYDLAVLAVNKELDSYDSKGTELFNACLGS